MHGALFIFEIDSKIKKISKGEHPTLDEAIQDRISKKNGYPLFISEGSPEEKLANIKSNQYLSFCYDELRSMSGELDIYGHSLNPEVDGHIIEAVKESAVQRVRFYQFKLNELSKGEKEHLNSTLNSRLGVKVELHDSSEHDLCKWSIFEGF